jgi:hypothetical protein
MMSEEKNGAPPQSGKEIKSVSVPKGKVVDGTAFYIVRVDTGFNTWAVLKRYSQFELLHGHIMGGPWSNKIPSGVDLPPKKIKLFTSHVTPEFIEERRCLLENYLKRMVKVRDICESEPLQNFLRSDKDESSSAAEAEEVEMPEDVEITGVSVPSKRTMSDHILYQVDVVNVRKRKTFSKWTVLKRFGQFYEMDTALRASLAERIDLLAALPSPPERRSKILVDHMDEAFVEQRRVLLENYLKKMMTHLDIVRSPVFLSFLGVST